MGQSVLQALARRVLSSPRLPHAVDALNPIAYHPYGRSETSRFKTRWAPEASEATPHVGSTETKTGPFVRAR